MTLSEAKSLAASYGVNPAMLGQNCWARRLGIGHPGEGYDRDYKPHHVRLFALWQLIVETTGQKRRNLVVANAWRLAASYPSGYWVWGSDGRWGVSAVPNPAWFDKGAWAVRIP